MPRAAYDLSPFGQEHFGNADLGHCWRTASLVDQANRLVRHPRGALPEKLHDPNALRRLYDLMNTKAVTPAAVLKPSVQRTAELVLQQRGVVLALHDATELAFTGHTSLQDQVGPIGNGHGRGYLCHNSLAVLPSRQVLGLLGQYLPVRAEVPKDETAAQRREREDRARLLGLHGAAAAPQAVPEACWRQGRRERPEGLLRVDVCDRGGDPFEFLDSEDRLGRHQVVRVWEEHPPAGVEAVDWYLLTNVAVTTVAEAWERVDWQTCRQVREEQHKAQKTGCNIEGPPFETVAALQPMIALLSGVAVSLLDLRDRSRDPARQDEPATTVRPQAEVEVLSGWRYGQRRLLSVREFFLALARLGGHQNRRRDPPPGWLVLWRGWQALQLMVAGARAAARPRTTEPPGP